MSPPTTTDILVGGFQQQGTLSGSGSKPSFPSGLSLWLRSDLGITLNGSTVSGWADQSGNNNNASQGTGANQPTYVASGGANNQPYLSFTASGNQALVGASAVPGQPLEYIIVARSTVSSPSTSCYLFDCGTNINATYQVASQSCMRQYDGLVQVNTNRLNVNSDMIVDSVFNGTSSTLYVNGGFVGPNSPGTSTSATGYHVGNYGGGGAAGWGGYVYEVLVFNRVLAASERATVYNYLAARYGLPALPSLPVAAPSLWLRADLGVSTNVNGVTAWTDQSGNGNAVAQVTVAKQPTYNASGINSTPKLTFNGTTHYLSTANNMPVSNVTVFLVQQFASATPGAYNMLYSTRDNAASPGSAGLEIVGTPTNQRAVNVTGVSTDVADALTANAEIWQVTNAAGSIWNLGVNGALHAVNPNGGVASANSGGTYIGARNQGSLFFGGDLYEVIVYPFALNQTQINAVNAYLGTRYNIAVAQPVPPVTGMSAWYRSDLGITLNSTTVAAWGDQTYNGNHAKQATGANQPVYTASGTPFLSFAGNAGDTAGNFMTIVDNPALRMGSAGFYLYGIIATPVAWNTTHTNHIILDKTTGVTWQGVQETQGYGLGLGVGSGSGTGIFCGGAPFNSSVGDLQSGTIGGSAPGNISLSTTYFMELYYDGTNLPTLWLNGTNVMTGSVTIANTDGTTNVYIGCQSGGTVRFFSGNIYELGLIRQPTAAQQQAVQRYALARYGV